MAANNPKLEFFRFKLNQEDNKFRTFKNFACDNLKAKPGDSDEKTMNVLFRYFIKSLGSNIAKDDRLKKQIKLEEKQNINKHIKHKPAFSHKDSIIYGVINGGHYGRDRIMGDITNPGEGSQVGKDKTILHYYFFMLYVPLDHHEGCAIIHSNGKEETITNIFKNFIGNMFSYNDYIRPDVYPYCPKSFQEEFKNEAIVKTLEFKDIILSDMLTHDGLFEEYENFEIKIQIRPVNGNYRLGFVQKLREQVASFNFGNGKKQKKLDNFEETRIIAQNKKNNSIRTLEWDTREDDFVPVVYLRERINKWNDDDTPDFGELAHYCKDYLRNEIIPELRPDLYVTKT